MAAQPLPVPPGLEDAFRQFTNGSMPTAVSQHGVGLAAEWPAGIPWGQQKSHMAPNRQVVEVIAEECCAGLCDTELLLQC